MMQRPCNVGGCREAGLSLIELMVALLLGSFLLLGVTQVYIDNKRNYLFQQSQAGNQEGIRYAELVLREYLGKAGFRRAPDQPLEDAFPALAASSWCQEFTAGASVTGLKDGIGLCIRYQPMVSGELDCEGNSTPAFTDDMFRPSPQDSTVVLAISYAAAPAGSGLHTGSLRCKNVNAATAGYVELLDGIADLRLAYGLGVPSLFEKKLKDSGATDRFKPATQWAVSDGPIRAVRYELLMASQENMRDGDSAILDAWLAGAAAADKQRLENGDNRRIYQVARNTQMMRNLMP